MHYPRVQNDLGDWCTIFLPCCVRWRPERGLRRGDGQHGGRGGEDGRIRRIRSRPPGRPGPSFAPAPTGRTANGEAAAATGPSAAPDTPASTLCSLYRLQILPRRPRLARWPPLRIWHHTAMAAGESVRPMAWQRGARGGRGISCNFSLQFLEGN